MNRFYRVLATVLAVLFILAALKPAAAQNDRLVTVGTLVELYTVDPAVGFDQAIGSSLKQFYDALFRYEGNPPKVQPWLAESFDVSKDGLTYTIKLRKEAVFHDGSPLNAAAVVYSAERLLKVNQGAAGLFQGVLSPGKTTAVDDTTVKFTLDQPYGPFPDILTWLFIVNPKVVEANKGSDNGVTWLTNHEAGSGPFTMGRWQAGELYEFLAVDKYWRGWPNDSHPTSVIRQVMREAATRRLAIEKGQVDMVDWMSVDDIKALDGQNGIKGAPGPTLTVYDVKMNTKNGPTSDPDVRRAIAYAVDYDSLAAIWGGKGTLLTGPLPPSLATKKAPVYKTDLDKAKAELAKSQFPKGGDIEFVYVTGLEDERRTGLVIQDSLSKIGFNVKLTAVPWADAVATFKDPKTSPSLFPLYSGTAFADPDNFLWAGFNSSLAGNWTNPGHYSNPKTDDLLKQARAATDATKRATLYGQVEDLILSDSPSVFVAATPEDHIVGPRLTNYAAMYCPVMGSMEDFYFYAVGK